jgi:hypothetical protein
MATSSTSITVKLAADGKNWKDWNKQLINCASADSAYEVLEGSTRPRYNATSDRYTITPMFRPDHKQSSTEAEIAAEVARVGKLNKAIHPINSEARQAQKEDELRYNQ